MTNLVQAITVISLVTNTFIRWPQKLVPLPCPDGQIGCLVFHAKYEDDTNSKTREEVTETREIHETKVLGQTFTRSNILKSTVVIPQTQVVSWVAGNGVTNVGQSITNAGLWNILNYAPHKN